MTVGLLVLALLAASPTWERVGEVRAREDFALPTPDERFALSALTADLARLAPQGVLPAEAEERAEALGYRLERNGRRVWLTDVSGRGGAVLGLYMGPLKHEVILQAPHPWFDRYTGEIAAAIFDERPVRAVVIAATHRREAPGSDAAHSPEHALTALTDGLSRGLRRAVVVQLHGFGASEDRSANIYVAGGRSWWRAEDLTLARDALGSRLGVVVEPGARANGLAGRTNTQARLLEARDPVLLLELDRQLRERLRDEASARTLLVGALHDVCERLDHGEQP